MKYVKSGLARTVKNCFEAFKLFAHTPQRPPNEEKIHLLNGVLNVNGSFEPIIRFCNNRLAVEYNPTAKPPEKFMLFLSNLLETDDLTTLWQYLGYLLIPSTKGQAMLSIIGNGGEGKSVLGTVLQGIFGDSLMTGSIQRVETDRFFRANLQNKLVLLDDDMQLEALPSTGYLKSLITAQTPTDVEIKGQQSFQAQLYCRFLCFGNGSIKSLYDKSDGFARRMIILSAKPVPQNRVTNRNLASEILAEKQGIFNWIFEGLQNLIAHNFRFSVSERAKQNVTEMMSDNCNIIEFLADNTFISFDVNAETTSANLYGAYTLWCNENAMTPLKRDTFINWLKQNEKKYGFIYTNRIIGECGRLVRGFKGIKSNYKPILFP